MTTIPTASRLETFHPAWGALLMAVSGTALVSLRDPVPWSTVDDAFGLVLLALGALAGVIITAVYLARFVRYRAAFLADLANPGLGAMIASLPAGLLIFSLATLQAGTAGILDPTFALTIGLVAAIPGLLGTVVAGFAFYAEVIGNREVPTAAVTGSWFIPVVPLVLLPSILFRAVALGLPGEVSLWAFIAIVGWGTGFALFLLLAPTLGERLIVSAPPTAHQAPSWFAWLAPLGAGGLGVLAGARLVEEATPIPGLVGGAGLLMTVLWGFSVWWLVFALGILLRARRELRFHVGWWGFGFPAAAFVAVTDEVAGVWEFDWLDAAIPVLWVLLLAVFALLAFLTVRARVRGTVWQR